jgi:hypothetical protein
MATTTINDLPLSRALDYKARAAIKGGSGAAWVFGAFRPFSPESARVAPIVFNQINLIAEQLTLQFQNINVENSAPNSQINVNAGQAGFNFDFAPIILPTLP